jgi:hypothetical protein
MKLFAFCGSFHIELKDKNGFYFPAHVVQIEVSVKEFEMNKNTFTIENLE